MDARIQCHSRHDEGDRASMVKSSRGVVWSGPSDYATTRRWTIYKTVILDQRSVPKLRRTLDNLDFENRGIMQQNEHQVSPKTLPIGNIRHWTVWLGITVALLCTIGWPAGPLWADTTAPAEPHLYLPLISRANDSTPTPTTVPTQGTTPSPTPTATRTTVPNGGATPSPTPTATATQDTSSQFFVATDQKTGSANIAVDANGGVHLALYAEVPVNNKLSNALFYFYCAGPLAHCGGLDSGQWQGMSGLYGVREVQLELNSAGQPRLLIQADSVVYSGGKDYIYLECNAQCTDGNNWQGDVVVSTDGTATFDVRDLDLPQRYFELDPEGRPRFVYLNRNYFHVEPDLYGGYYAWCDTDCATPSNWQTAAITTFLPGTGQWEPLQKAALAFTSSGQPRVVGELAPLQGETGIYYLACDSACDQLANWQRTRLSDRGQGPELSWDLEMNNQDQPRVVYAPAELPDGSGEQLYYAWCNTDCLETSNWQRTNLGLGVKNGTGADLELNAQGQPRVAYALYDQGGLGYARCDQNCESSNAWQSQVIESRVALETAWPVAFPTHCDGGIWDGQTPVLALDAAGAPHIAYDTYYSARCWYDEAGGEWKPYYEFHVIQRAVRVNAFTQP